MRKRMTGKTTTMAAAAAMMLAAGYAQAQTTYNWRGESTANASWAQRTNWTPTPPVGFVMTDQDDVVFYTLANRLDNFIQENRTINSLTFNTNANLAVGIQLGGTQGSRNLTFAGTTPHITIEEGAQGSHVIGSNGGSANHQGSVVLNADLLVAHNGSGTLTIRRPVTQDATARGITKTGTGTLVLSGENTYAGATTVSNGTLLVNGGHTNATGTITVNDGAFLGGSGFVGGNIVLADGAGYRMGGILTANGSSVDLGNLAVARVAGLSATSPAGTNTLITGSAIFDFSGVQNLGPGNAATIAGRSAYFLEEDGLKLVFEGGSTNGLVWLDFAPSTNSVEGILPTSPVLATGSGAFVEYGAETNFYYDIGSLDIGGTATTVELNIVSVNGESINQINELGLGVNSGNTNWWESGEDLEFTLKVLDAGGNDVSSDYYVDLVGVEMRYRLSGVHSATFNGETVSSTAGGIVFSMHDLSVGDEDEFFVQASRNSFDVAQLSALRFNLVPKGVTTEEPAEIVAIRPVAGGLLQIEINAPTPGLSCLKGKGDLVYGAWARVPHSDNGVNEFKQATLSYSTSSGSNVLIYVQGDASSAFFGTGPQ